jgi:hypothetical protein
MFVWFSQQAAVISQNSFNQPAFIMDAVEFTVRYELNIYVIKI